MHPFQVDGTCGEAGEERDPQLAGRTGGSGWIFDVHRAKVVHSSVLKRQRPRNAFACPGWCGGHSKRFTFVAPTDVAEAKNGTDFCSTLRYPEFLAYLRQSVGNTSVDQAAMDMADEKTRKSGPAREKLGVCSIVRKTCVRKSAITANETK